MNSDKKIGQLSAREERQLQAARKLFCEVGEQLNVDLSIKLWDGSVIPLGTDVQSDLLLIIKASRRHHLFAATAFAGCYNTTLYQGDD